MARRPPAPVTDARRPSDALAQVADWPVDSAAAIVIAFEPVATVAGRDRLEVLGAAGPVDRRFPWASVTKLATALCVLIACEEGTISLDDRAGPPGSTVRHLLAHASGLGPDPGLPLAPPGVSRIYSNAGYHLLGDLVAERSGISFAAYLAEGVLAPLGMTATRMGGGSAPRDRLDADAAAGLAGPATDLAALAAEWAWPTLIGPETHAMATSVAFPGLAGVLPGYGRFEPCEWGLGPERRGHKQPHWTGGDNSPATYGHFGQSGAFLWVDPVAGVACVEVSDRPFGLWASRAWPPFADAVLSEVAGADIGSGSDRPPGPDRT